MPAAAFSSIPQTPTGTYPPSSPSSHFVPRQPRQLTPNSFQSPYFYRASGLLQIAVSALLRTNSAGAPESLAAEHCRYGTRDFALIEITADEKGVYQ
jgi:hypothetical protein